jgi:hypothetical protein
MTATTCTSHPSSRNIAVALGATGFGASGASTLIAAVAHSIGAADVSAPLGSGLGCVIAGTLAAVFTGSVRASDRPASRSEARTHGA